MGSEFLSDGVCATSRSAANATHEDQELILIAINATTHLQARAPPSRTRCSTGRREEIMEAIELTTVGIHRATGGADSRRSLSRRKPGSKRGSEGRR
jgi:hypothetical protein